MRLDKSVTLRMQVDDNTTHSCLIIGSVRQVYVSLRIQDGQDNWAHLDVRQAKRLQSYLARALDEIEQRRKSIGQHNQSLED